MVKICKKSSRGIFEDINLHRIKLLFVFIESYGYAGMIQSDIRYENIKPSVTVICF